MTYIKKTFKLFSFLLPAVVALGFLVLPAVSHAQTADEQKRCETFARYFNFGNDNLVRGLPQYCSMTQLLAEVTEKLLIFAGAVTVLFIIFGGFLYVTSAGNEEQSEKGRKILTNSIIGLVVIIMSATIVRIVANTLNRAPAGGGGGTTTTTGGGGTGGGGAGGGGAGGGGGNTSTQNPGGLTNAEMATIAGFVNIDVSGGRMNVPVIIPNAAYPLMNKLCGSTNFPTGAELSAEWDGAEVGTPRSFRQNSAQATATLTVPFSELTSGTHSVIVYICDEQVAVKVDAFVPQQ